MSRLIRLYPTAWRDRYEVEFLELLQERPVTLRDTVDVLWGAIDARVHPQQVGAGSPGSTLWTNRIPGLLAMTAGLMWSGTYLYLSVGRNWDASWGSLIPLSLILMFVSLPGDYMAAYRRQIGFALALIGLCVVAANVLPWPLTAIAIAFGSFLAYVGMLTLAAVRAEIGAGARWVLIAGVVAIPGAIGIPVSLGLVGSVAGPWPAVALLLPWGFAWVVVGLRMAIRGSPTIIDPPISQADSEVQVV